MAKNSGKVFEQDFRKSLNLENPDLFFYRFKDSPASFGNHDNQFIRFTNNNICDNMIFYKGYLFLNELKMHKGKSLPFSCIKENQFQEMYNASFKKNVYPMVIIFLSDIEECYVIQMRDVVKLRGENKTKSISLSFMREKGFKIDSRKLQTHYRFLVEEFLDNFIKNI